MSKFSISEKTMTVEDVKKKALKPFLKEVLMVQHAELRKVRNEAKKVMEDLEQLNRDLTRMTHAEILTKFPKELIDAFNASVEKLDGKSINPDGTVDNE